jgi:predicted nucleic acid-binding protein
MGAIRWQAAGTRITWDDAEAGIAALSELGAVSHLPNRVDIDRAWELRHNVTPQDALYVALAERLDEPFITADLKLSRCDQLRCAVVALNAL